MIVKINAKILVDRGYIVAISKVYFSMGARPNQVGAEVGGEEGMLISTPIN